MYGPFYSYIALVVNKVLMFSNHKIPFTLAKVSTNEEDMSWYQSKTKFFHFRPEYFYMMVN